MDALFAKIQGRCCWNQECTVHIMILYMRFVTTAFYCSFVHQPMPIRYSRQRYAFWAFLNSVNISKYFFLPKCTWYSRPVSLVYGQTSSVFLTIATDAVVRASRFFLWRFDFFPYAKTILNAGLVWQKVRNSKNYYSQYWTETRMYTTKQTKN